LADNKDFEIRIYEKFPSDFDGVELGLDDDNDLAINDMKINEGLILLPGVFSMSYQELLLSQAIDKHFAKERENWFRQNGDLKAPKIKTLSLFFIDNIKSYREDGGWLRAKFETLLRNKLDTLISKETDEQYKLFLKATRSDLSGSHAGYFAKDNAKADEDIQKEIDDILRNKDEMLSFKRDDGSWNIRRFLFSKWTLREGWDNPNVFVIAKLRTSGSEISKLQEVGRGLRLPVDENGKRLSAEEFRLDYIVDWSEKDFADSLIAEINNDNLKISNDKITDAIVNKLVEVKYADNDDKVKAKLLLEDIRDKDDKILKKEALLALLPKDFIEVVRRGKITDNGRNRRPKIKLREQNWEHLKDLWSKVTRRYFLQFEKLETSDFNKILSESLNGKIFVSPIGSITSVSMKFNDEKKQFGTEVSTSDAPAQIGVLPYGEFLKRLSKETSINPKIWHLAFVKKFNAPIEKELINDSSLKNIIENYKKTFGEVFAQKYKYDALDYSADTSLIKDGKFVGELEQNLIGTTLAESIAVEENYLYDKKAYDSDIEREVLQRTPAEQVLTFGKLPRRSIKVPTYTGGTTSPDFVYAIKDENGKVKLNLLIETKAKDTRLGENIALEAQKKLFANIENVKWHMINDADKISQILNELIQ
jgi:type III restriction enzyme